MRKHNLVLSFLTSFKSKNPLTSFRTESPYLPLPGKKFKYQWMRASFISYSIILCSILLNLESVQSQPDCQTPPGTLYPDHSMDGKSTLGPNDDLVINVYLHIVRDDNGDGGLNESEVEDAMDKLDFYFNPYNIYFNYCIIEFDCSECRDSWTDLSANFPTQSLDEGINAYIIPDSESSIPRSRAEAVPSKNLLYLYPAFTQTFAHEVGHCLGLLHTFEGSQCPNGLPEEYAWFYDQGILTPGSNCMTAGDLICIFKSMR